MSKNTLYSSHPPKCISCSHGQSFSDHYYTLRVPTGALEDSICQCKRRRRCVFDPWVREDPLEKETATHCIFLPEESYGQGNLMDYGLQSMGSQKSWTQLSMHKQAYGRLTHQKSRSFRCFGGILFSQIKQSTLAKAIVTLKITLP